jgi:hypothetical protein
MDQNGTTHPWMKNIPDAWYPSSLSDVQLVLAMQEETEKLIETCKYETGPDIKRYRYSIDVELREAKTGTLVSNTPIYGEPPRQCEFVENMKLTSLEGTHISFDNLRRWLELYVMDIKEVAVPDTGVTSTLAVVVHSSSPIKTMNDIDKSNVAFCSAGPEQFSSGLVRDIGYTMLAPYALDYNPMLLLADDVLRGMEAGIIDCAFILAEHPWKPLQDSKYEYRFLSFSNDARVLAGDCWDFIEPAIIPANTYQNQTQDIMTIGSIE